MRLQSGALVHLYVRETKESLRTDLSGSPTFSGGIVGGV